VTTNLAGPRHIQAIHPFAFLPKTLGLQAIKKALIPAKTVFRLHNVLPAPSGVVIQKTLTDFALTKNLIVKSSHFVVLS
jgi:hypothetical protein